MAYGPLLARVGTLYLNGVDTIASQNDALRFVHFIDRLYDLGIPLQTRRLTRDDLYIADEAFFSGTAAEITPIREIDGRRIGAGARGPITEKLQAAFFDAAHGRNPTYHHWLHPV